MKNLIRTIYYSGWFRIYLIVHTAILGWLGYRYYEYSEAIELRVWLAKDRMENHDKLVLSINEGRKSGFDTSLTESVLKNFRELDENNERQLEKLYRAPESFFFFGLLMPPLFALAITWVACGFRKSLR